MGRVKAVLSVLNAFVIGNNSGIVLVVLYVPQESGKAKLLFKRRILRYAHLSDSVIVVFIHMPAFG